MKQQRILSEMRPFDEKLVHAPSKRPGRCILPLNLWMRSSVSEETRWRERTARPGEIRAKLVFCQDSGTNQAGGNRALFGGFLSQVLSRPFLTTLFTAAIPFFIPFIHFRKSQWTAGSPLLVARYAPPHWRLLTLLRSQFDQPYGLTKQSYTPKKEGFTATGRRLLPALVVH